MSLPKILAALAVPAVLMAAPAQAQPRIVPVESRFSAFEPIQVRWTNMPTSLTYATAVLVRSSDSRSMSTRSVDLSNAEKRREGILTFDGTLPGDYEVRILAESNFVVARTVVAVFDPNAEPAPAQPPAATPGRAPAIPAPEAPAGAPAVPGGMPRLQRPGG
ncbi:MAG TPA: hypothetical protein VEA41_14880 [Salinarimonas sp.]|jgi:hypothetical protein|nr:hypothetical protein [Salinarimonas sp.]